MKSVFFHINRSLSLKLSLGILLFVVMVFVLSLGFLFQRSRQLVKQEAMEHATRMLENTALRVTGYLDEVEKATDNMEWLAIKNLQPDSLYNYTRRVVELNPNVNGCSITMEPAFFPQFGTPFSVYSLRGHDTIETVIEGNTTIMRRCGTRLLVSGMRHVGSIPSTTSMRGHSHLPS